jgi:hypothetical protein
MIFGHLLAGAVSVSSLSDLTGVFTTPSELSSLMALEITIKQ